MSRLQPIAAASAGFTLIELMVVVGIFGLLMLTAVPMFGTFSANTQIRNAAESMLSGVRLAQMEAVKRNGTVEFVLAETTGWTVSDVSDPNAPATLRTVQFLEGSKQTTVAPANGLRTVTFNGLGRVAANADGTLPLAQVDVTTSLTVSGPRNLRLIIGPALARTNAAALAYGIKVCDPAMPSTDVTGCP